MKCHPCPSIACLNLDNLDSVEGDLLVCSRNFARLRHNAAIRQEFNEQTQMTELADGADNCWLTISALKP